MSIPSAPQCISVLALALAPMAWAQTPPSTKDGMDGAVQGGAMMGGGATPEQVEFFEMKIRPIFEANCVKCHSSKGERLRGGLRIDTRALLIEGGDSGAAIVPGDPDSSLLIRAVRYQDTELQMPPKSQLTAEQVADLERWIRMGAPDPRESEASGEVMVSEPTEVDIEKGKKFWSFVPPTKPEIPAVEDGRWCHGEIDRFVLAKMEEHNVLPVQDADKRTLIRRLTFDLTGLPPTDGEIQLFERDKAKGAYGRLVDRLLASPRFGERWGRHWMDTARFAESSGKERNILYPHAWRYRDWIIKSLNEDKPYDQFLREQLAGDLLPAEDDTDRAWKQIATGFLAVGAKGHNTQGRGQFLVDLADEQIMAVGQGMLGITVHCARCHDHKFDPIPTADYYALAGIFLSTETMFGTERSQGNRHASDLVTLPPGADVPNGPRMTSQQRTFLTTIRDRAAREAGLNADGTPSGAQVDPQRARQARDQIDSIDGVFERFDESGAPTLANRLAMGAREATPMDAPILIRGELDKRGEKVSRGVLQVMTDSDTPRINSGSGRLELAEWVTNPSNALTARVAVNRVWLHLFGKGIVPTPDNFGSSGQAPTHPELLDHLATSFIEDGWSVKRLIRRIVSSHSYQLASKNEPANAKRDPDIAWLWRMPNRRLEGEAIRDAMLSVSGTLDTEPPIGSPVGVFEGGAQVASSRFVSTDMTKRSVFLPQVREQTEEALDVFDFIDTAFVTSDRDETNVPAQALYLMNDPRVVSMAQSMADRLVTECKDDNERVRRGFELAFGRLPTSSEGLAARSFLKDFAKIEQAAGTQPGEMIRLGWTAFCQGLFESAEFRYLD